MATRWLIFGWVAVTSTIAGYLGTAFVTGERQLFTPGETTRGHHQIEPRCEACHSPGRGVTQDACLDCHEDELDAKADSHAPSRFRDPRNAEYLEQIDARRCVTCHEEHRPDRTGAMSVTQPVEFCKNCHADVVETRESHRGLAFSSCQDAGCHNYHDNRTLNADYLGKQAATPELVAPARVPQRRPPPGPEVEGTRLRADDQDASPSATAPPAVVEEWEQSAHARGGVHCTDCHGEGAAWDRRPGAEACESCHDGEAQGFEGGLHGMRRRAGLSLMTPGKARLPMKADARDRKLDCTACHGDHTFDTQYAAAEACLDCHADEHSLAYEGSPHHGLWKDEIEGRAAPGSGVSCATCHLPRTRAPAAHSDADGGRSARVEHNQSRALRPRDAMVRSVCRHCHGAAFSLSALVADELIRTNFRAPPAARARTFELLEHAKGEP